MKKRWVAWLLLLTGISMVLAGAAYTQIHARFQHPHALPLPAELAGFSMTAKQQGWRAVDAFVDLHRQKFPLDGGAIGYYGLNHEATLWVARAPFAWMARNMVAAMEKAIAGGSSPFSPLRTWQHEDHTIHELTGLGQRHYYYQEGRLVIWLGIDREVAETGLSQVMAYYP